jgi:hypothetical protein
MTTATGVRRVATYERVSCGHRVAIPALLSAPHAEQITPYPSCASAASFADLSPRRAGRGGLPAKVPGARRRPQPGAVTCPAVTRRTQPR